MRPGAELGILGQCFCRLERCGAALAIFPFSRSPPGPGGSGLSFSSPASRSVRDRCPGLPPLTAAFPRSSAPCCPWLPWRPPEGPRSRLFLPFPRSQPLELMLRLSCRERDLLPSPQLRNTNSAAASVRVLLLVASLNLSSLTDCHFPVFLSSLFPFPF